MAPRDGDGFVVCACGEYHWGRHGAAGLLLVRRDLAVPQVLLQLRAAWTHGGGTWALPGGAIDSHEDERVAALREAWEEAGIAADRVDVVDVFVDDHGSWRYSTVIAHTDGDAAAWAANAESEAMRWVPLDDVAGFDLHPGLAAAWPDLQVRTRASLAGR
jgi:8-oxo-dGTP pyrophosphatase MutT (NUDIX family)